MSPGGRGIDWRMTTLIVAVSLETTEKSAISGESVIVIFMTTAQGIFLTTVFTLIQLENKKCLKPNSP